MRGTRRARATTRRCGQQYHADVKAGRRHFPAIGLAKVRREGFVSRDAGADGGTLTTRLHAAGWEPAGGERGRWRTVGR